MNLLSDVLRPDYAGEGAIGLVVMRHVATVKRSSAENVVLSSLGDPMSIGAAALRERITSRLPLPVTSAF